MHHIIQLHPEPSTSTTPPGRSPRNSKLESPATNSTLLCPPAKDNGVKSRKKSRVDKGLQHSHNFENEKKMVTFTTRKGRKTSRPIDGYEEESDSQEKVPFTMIPTLMGSMSTLMIHTKLQYR